jgi:hypothetical protein
LFAVLVGGFITLAIAPPGLFGGGVGLVTGTAGPTGDAGVDTAIGFWNVVSVKTTAVTLAVASGVVPKVTSDAVRVSPGTTVSVAFPEFVPFDAGGMD